MRAAPAQNQNYLSACSNNNDMAHSDVSDALCKTSGVSRQNNALLRRKASKRKTWRNISRVLHGSPAYHRTPADARAPHRRRKSTAENHRDGGRASRARPALANRGRRKRRIKAGWHLCVSANEHRAAHLSLHARRGSRTRGAFHCSRRSLLHLSLRVVGRRRRIVPSPSALPLGNLARGGAAGNRRRHEEIAASLFRTHALALSFDCLLIK